MLLQGGVELSPYCTKRNHILDRIMRRVVQSFSGNSLISRVMRGSAITITGVGAALVLRLFSNLVLTRLLFPEAFGVMALVTVLMIGLTMFSDVGVTPSIMRSPRGDDPAFLNTAWTMQVMRGGVLWLVACGVAWPMGYFYNAPELALLVPVAGLVLFIAGFEPTSIDTAGRHLALGRLTVLDLLSQLISTIVIVALAFLLKSVWALVIGYLAGGVIRLVLMSLYMPGLRNKFAWEKDAVHELVHFGKWVFLSTVAGFLVNQSDKAILGKFLSLDQLGIYNIGFFLATFPLLLLNSLASRLMIPIYRERPPADSRKNFLALRKVRSLLTGGVLTLSILLAFVGPMLVDLMYDARYEQAGGIMVLLAVCFMPHMMSLTYDHAALSAGDSRRFFFVTGARAVLQVSLFVAGAIYFGLIGAIVGQGIAFVLAYPVIAAIARRFGAWDPIPDICWAILMIVMGSLALWVNADAVTALTGL
jgi:O-antigen/teichoic acid export membrane protein